MISQTAEYALRAVVFLAEDPEHAQAIPAIAHVTKVPTQYLSKVMQNLARHGVVLSHRGVKGGYTLSRPPAQVTLYEIVNAVDPVQRILSCPLGLDSHRERMCPLHARLDKACADVEGTLRRTTLAEIMAEAELPLSRGGRPHPLH